MKISLLALSAIAVVSILLIIFNPEFTTIFFVILGAVVVNGMIIDLFVHRLEDRLLRHSVHFFEDTRQDYQELGIVEDAIYEATQTAHPDAAKHGERVYEILVSEDYKKALNSFHEVSPNRWYRLFAGIALWIKEYGDRDVKNGSLFMHSIGQLVSEMNYEIRRRDKLNYLLQGLATIALAPILVTGLLRDWAKTHFPIMIDFYNSKAGLTIQVSFYLIVLIAYLLIRKIQENDQSRYSGKAKRIEWEKFLYEKTPMNWVVDRIKPRPFQSGHKKLILLLKQANSSLTLEWLYIQRITVTVLSFLLTITLFIMMHVNTANHILHNPLQGMGMYGKLSEQELQKAMETTAFDREVIQKLEQIKHVNHETVIQVVSDDMNIAMNDEAIFTAAERIFTKYSTLQNEYFKWWELVIGLLISLIAYHCPVWLLEMQKRIRHMEMQDEVDQFNSVITILREFERMDAETLLEWLEPFAVIFQDTIKYCLNDYSSGAIQALENMKRDSPFPEFERLVDKLKNSVEKVPLKVAFDDLERAQEHYREVRKEHHMRVIEKKSFYGKIIGFTPMTYLVVMYLVIPMLYLSTTEMGKSMSNIRNI
ncbi:hypothetical protein [Paenibacillus agilis]|nr:hypothetical protein [Paenibacillus agilis]